MPFLNTFITEVKLEGGIYIFVGCVSILLALFFWLIIKYSFHKGMACSLCVIGFLQLWHGYKLFVLPEQIPFITNQTETIHQLIYESAVMRNTGIVLFAISLTGFIVLRNSFLKFWKGLALGLLVQAAIIVPMETSVTSNFSSYLNYRYMK